MTKKEDEFTQIPSKTFDFLIKLGWSVRGIKVWQTKKLQITHKIDDGLKHEKLHVIILTSIEFVQENFPDIQT